MRERGGGIGMLDALGTFVSHRTLRPGRMHLGVVLLRGESVRRIAAVWFAALAANGCGGEQEAARYTNAVPPPILHLEDRYPDAVEVDSATVPRSIVARGDSLYHGVVPGANCMACHGPFLTVGTGGLNLKDGRWHNGDGSYGFIVSVVENGISNAEHLSMPPRGGMPISDDDVRAIAAYVYWKSRGQPADSLSVRARTQTR